MRRITGSVSLVLFLLAGIGSPVLAVDWNPLPDTGQDKCYDMAGGEIVCPEPGNNLHGQDGNYQSVSAYYQPDNGVILDKNTNLMWQQNGVSGYLWENAVAYCSDLVLGVHDDWRLPTRMELRSIVDFSKVSPASDPVFKSYTDTNYLGRTCTYSSTYSGYCYWTSSVDAANELQAWMLRFYNGADYYIDKGWSGRVRCVRP